MNKHFAICPNGQRVTRNSKGRVYSHVVVGRHNYPAELAFADGYGNLHVHRSNWVHYTQTLNGTSRFLLRNSWETEEQHKARVELDQAHARKALLGAETLKAYRNALRAEAIAKVEAKKAAGEYEVYHDLGWASRRDLAEKNLAAHAGRFVDLTILDAIRMVAIAEQVSA